ncbi:hypothetical protein GOP47_0027509 [Adiantum capillus-veneris]|nr:hypothetical protein GOP47_0027509 [Adiantum capillus-veneris]
MGPAQSIKLFFGSKRLLSTACSQRTISRAVSRSGFGLHTGTIAHLTLLPAAAGEGRYFVHLSKRGNLREEEVRVPASIQCLKETNLSTCISQGNVKIRTIEHLLSALEGIGVHNCRIEVQGGDEVPILDGSARLWVEAIHAAGLEFALDKEGNKVEHTTFSLMNPIHVTKADSFIAAFPSPDLRITYGIEFKEVSAIGTQVLCGSKVKEVIASMRAAGLIKGGSVENALICSTNDGWLNPPLRFSDEPCRHKLLDLIGDLALCAENGNSGLPNAHIVAFKAGHLLHTKFSYALLEAKEHQRRKAIQTTSERCNAYMQQVG